jgi:hypothetical protein
MVGGFLGRMKEEIVKLWRPAFASIVVLAVGLALTPIQPSHAQDGNIPKPGSPVIVDLSNNGFNLTNPANGVDFDIDANGNPDRVAWTALGSDDGFLVLDRNNNGQVDDSRELFGTMTPGANLQNGWVALAVYDVNDDDYINTSDTIFPSLRIWVDVNHNGLTDHGTELKPLSFFNIVGIHIMYQTESWTDQWGNEFRWPGLFLKAGPGARTAYDVYLRYVPGT